MRFKPRKPKNLRLDAAILVGSIPGGIVLVGGVLGFNYLFTRFTDLPWYISYPVALGWGWYYGGFCLYLFRRYNYLDRLHKFTCWAQGWRCDGCNRVIEYDPELSRNGDEPALCGTCFFRSNLDTEFREKVKASVSL